MKLNRHPTTAKMMKFQQLMNNIGGDYLLVYPSLATINLVLVDMVDRCQQTHRMWILDGKFLTVKLMRAGHKELAAYVRDVSRVIHQDKTHDKTGQEFIQLLHMEPDTMMHDMILAQVHVYAQWMLAGDTVPVSTLVLCNDLLNSATEIVKVTHGLHLFHYNDIARKIRDATARHVGAVVALEPCLGDILRSVQTAQDVAALREECHELSSSVEFVAQAQQLIALLAAVFTATRTHPEQWTAFCEVVRESVPRVPNNNNNLEQTNLPTSGRMTRSMTKPYVRKSSRLAAKA